MDDKKWWYDFYQRQIDDESLSPTAKAHYRAAQEKLSDPKAEQLRLAFERQALGFYSKILPYMRADERLNGNLKSFLADLVAMQDMNGIIRATNATFARWYHKKSEKTPSRWVKLLKSYGYIDTVEHTALRPDKSVMTIRVIIVKPEWCGSKAKDFSRQDIFGTARREKTEAAFFSASSSTKKSHIQTHKVINDYYSRPWFSTRPEVGAEFSLLDFLEDESILENEFLMSAYDATENFLIRTNYGNSLTKGRAAVALRKIARNMARQRLSSVVQRK